MGLGISNRDRILAEFQNLRVGDRIPMGPGENADIEVTTLEPNRFLGLSLKFKQGSVSWSFGLYPVDEAQTRLVSRNRAYASHWTLRSILSHPERLRVELPMKLFIDLGGLLMVRRMLRGIKQRVEHARDLPPSLSV